MGNLVSESREQYAGTEFIGEIAARFGVLVGDITAVAQPVKTGKGRRTRLHISTCRIVRTLNVEARLPKLCS